MKKPNIKKAGRKAIYPFRELKVNGSPVFIKNVAISTINGAAYSFRINNPEYKFRLHSDADNKGVWVYRVDAEKKSKKGK